MHDQLIFSDRNEYSELSDYLKNNGTRSLFVVCGKSIKNFPVELYLNSLKSSFNIEVVRFSDFSPNPKYEDVLKGINTFINAKSDVIMAVGGGSAIDIAKCIKAFCNVQKNDLPDCDVSYSPDFNKLVKVSNVPLICMPTTAGSGAEATHFAVMYFNYKKYSISALCLRPTAVVFSPCVLDSLPSVQKQSTFLDALSHSIESYWSINATEESIEYSVEALNNLLRNFDGYFNNNEKCYEKMLWASYTAGRAINISKTTAGHALSYKLTSEFNIPHGYAVAMCLKHVWKKTIEKAEYSNNKNLIDKLISLSRLFGGQDIREGLELFNKLLKSLITKKFKLISSVTIDDLSNSVNVERLKNHPVSFSKDDIVEIYKNVMREFYEN